MYTIKNYEAAHNLHSNQYAYVKLSFSMKCPYINLRTQNLIHTNIQLVDGDSVVLFRPNVQGWFLILSSEIIVSYSDYLVGLGNLEGCNLVRWALVGTPNARFWPWIWLRGSDSGISQTTHRIDIRFMAGCRYWVYFVGLFCGVFLMVLSEATFFMGMSLKVMMLNRIFK